MRVEYDGKLEENEIFTTGKVETFKCIETIIEIWCQLRLMRAEKGVMQLILKNNFWISPNFTRVLGIVLCNFGGNSQVKLNLRITAGRSGKGRPTDTIQIFFFSYIDLFAKYNQIDWTKLLHMFNIKSKKVLYT